MPTAAPQTTTCTHTSPPLTPALTCLQRLAESWIGTRDLCAGCTTRLMAALDAASPEPLTWHAEYRRRAAGGAR